MVNREAYIEVVWRCDSIQLLVLLCICLTIVTYHYILDVSCSVACVGYIYRYLCTIHGSQPGSPISAIFYNLGYVGILFISTEARTPAPVICTKNTIFVIRRIGEYGHEVLVVTTTSGVVGECSYVCLTWSHLDLL